MRRRRSTSRIRARSPSSSSRPTACSRRAQGPPDRTPAAPATIRLATDADVAAIGNLLRELLPATYDFLPRAEVAEWVERYADADRWRRAIANPDARVLVAGDVVGLAQLAPPNPDGWWDEGLYLGSIYVRERGRGIGSALVRRALALAGDFGAERVRAEVAERNAGGRRFLARHGFERCGEPTDWLGARWLSLCRSLTSRDP